MSFLGNIQNIVFWTFKTIVSDNLQFSLEIKCIVDNSQVKNGFPSRTKKKKKRLGYGIERNSNNVKDREKQLIIVVDKHEFQTIDTQKY